MKTIAQQGDGPSRLRGKLIQVEIPDDLARRAKAAAAMNGWPLRELVTQSIERFLSETERAA